jgi:hypothetical protein
MEFKVGDLYYIAWGLNDSPVSNRPNPEDIYGIGIFKHVQMSRGEKSYNFGPCMTLSGVPNEHTYCIGEKFNVEANKYPVSQKLKDTFYKLYPNLEKKDSVIDLKNILKPTASSIIEFIQGLETENNKLKEENKKLKDLHNNTCELLEKISDLYERYQSTN